MYKNTYVKVKWKLGLKSSEKLLELDGTPGYGNPCERYGCKNTQNITFQKGREVCPLHVSDAQRDPLSPEVHEEKIMEFTEQLDAALDYCDKLRDITKTEEYKNALAMLKESYLEIPSVISELTAQDVIARLLALYKKHRQPLAQADVAKVVAQSLRDEGYGNGDEREIMSKTTELMSDQGVMSSILLMLKKSGVEYIRPKVGV